MKPRRMTIDSAHVSIALTEQFFNRFSRFDFVKNFGVSIATIVHISSRPTTCPIFLLKYRMKNPITGVSFKRLFIP